jgi:transcriptional antiterminator NusG
MSGHEKKVKKALLDNIKRQHLENFISEIIIPTENVQEVKKGTQKIVEKRVWPGYIIIKMELTDDSWQCIKNSNGVIDFLGGGQPTPLSQKEIDEILVELEAKKSGVVQKHKIDVGDTVKINEGVFINFIGTVTEVNYEKGKLSVLVSIFGRDTRVDDLEFWQVEQVSSEDAN